MAETKAIIKKKKKWYRINASKEFKNSFIGESLSDELNNLIGKTINVNLINLTNDPKKQNFKIKFKINEVKNDEAFTEFVSYYAMSTYVKRMIRPGKSKVEDSFNIKSKSNKDFVVKTFLTARSKISNSIKTNLRMKSREFLGNYLREKDIGEILNNLLNGSLQKDLKSVLNKIYPLTMCQIRVFEVNSR